MNVITDVFDAISELRTVYAKSYLDVDNIEILFGAIEMGILLERFSARSLEGVRELRESFITLIYKTLESSIQYQFDGKQIQPTRGYSDFAELLRSLGGDAADYSNTSVITFNYDVALDYALVWLAAVTRSFPRACLKRWHENGTGSTYLKGTPRPR